MYERTKGLGWSEAPWSYEIATLGLNCELHTRWRKPRSVCFENNPEDEQIAHANQCTRYPNSPCTTQGREGSTWCCPDGYPRDYMRDIPSDVASYEAERRRLLAQEPASPQPEEPVPTPVLPPPSDPTPVAQHTFFTRLTHPGALTALAVLAGGGALLYTMYRRRARRRYV